MWRRVLPCGLAAALSLSGGCAPGVSTPRGPVVSPTGIVYENGVLPKETRYSQTASLLLRSNTPGRALDLAMEGIEADPENPIHYFLAGVAQARLDRYDEADGLLAEAQRIHPPYELDIEPERQAAWARAFNQGAEAYADGDIEGAVAAWEGATRMFALRAEAHRNLGMLLTQEGRLDDAVEVYRGAVAGLGREPVTRVLEEEEREARLAERVHLEADLGDILLLADRFAEAEPILRDRLAREPGDTQVRQDLAAALVGQGRREEAGGIYDGLLSDAEMADLELFSLGVALFRGGEPARAADAFGRLARGQPQSRDIWFNYANALFAAGAWDELVAAGERLELLDPLNENAALIIARAHLETGDQEEAARRVQRIDAAPVHVEGLVMRPAPGGVRLNGRIRGNEAEAGVPVNLRFTFYGGGQELTSERIVVSSPPPGESEGFEFEARVSATAFRYEVEQRDR